MGLEEHERLLGVEQQSVVYHRKFIAMKEAVKGCPLSSGAADKFDELDKADSSMDKAASKRGPPPPAAKAEKAVESPPAADEFDSIPPPPPAAKKKEKKD